ncbi:helix-turn-helix transcriptional regulator [Nonomuraea sp. NPDC049152]|uniref:helix-turn-helix domain-containing protein n=1 Tax=Nonomuraea sp. NPDC049152 TaxID=3154350 RepID=UPI003405C731
MARPEKPIEPGSPTADFALALRALRAEAGLSYREMAERSDYAISVMATAASGDRLPSWEVTNAYVLACGGSLERWHAQWQHARQSQVFFEEAGQDDTAPQREVEPTSTVDPASISTRAEFTAALKKLAGTRSIRELSNNSQGAMSPSSIARVLSGRAAVGPRTLEIFLRVCEVAPEQWGEWQEAQRRLWRPAESSRFEVSPPPGVDPADIATPAELADALDALRAGRSYAMMDRAVRPDRLPPSTISDLSRTGRSTAETLDLYLRACDVPRAQRRAWQAARERALASRPQAAGMLRVADADPRRLGVHAAIDVPGADGRQPVYIERDSDRGPTGLRNLVTRAADQGGMVVLVGHSSAGKSRSAYEAIRDVLPTWRLLHPRDADHLRHVASQSPSQMVVWLDELQHYLQGPAPVGEGTIRALLEAGAVVMATIWPSYYADYITPAHSGRPRAVEAARKVLELADVVHLSATFSEAEQKRARAAQATDPQIAAALPYSDCGLPQMIAAAPQMLERWRSAGPYAAAVLKAAIDATRLGADLPLKPDLLRAAAPRYCDERQRASAPPDWFEFALAYATTPLHGAAALMSPITSGETMGQVDGYVVADYLLQHYLEQDSHPAELSDVLLHEPLRHLASHGDQAATAWIAGSRPSLMLHLNNCLSTTPSLAEVLAEAADKGASIAPVGAVDDLRAHVIILELYHLLANESDETPSEKVVAFLRAHCENRQLGDKFRVLLSRAETMRPGP